MSLHGRLTVAFADNAVEFTLTVENRGSEPVDLEFRTGQVAEVIVYRDDTEVWRWSEDKLFTQAIQTERVSSGATFIHEMTWSDPSPGEYTAEASLAATNVSVRDRTEFEVP